jgi:hypothetical protein
VVDMRRRDLMFIQYCIRILGGGEYLAYVSAEDGPLRSWRAVTGMLNLRSLERHTEGALLSAGRLG